MGERPISEDDSTQKPKQTTTSQYSSNRSKAILVMFILSFVVIILAMIIMPFVRPDLYRSKLTTVFVLTYSVAASFVSAYWFSARRTGKKHARTALDYIDNLWIDTYIVRERVRIHTQWLTENETPDQKVLIEKLTGLKYDIMHLESGVRRALRSWEEVFPEQFEKIESLHSKLREDPRYMELQTDMDNLKKQIADAKTDEEKQKLTSDLAEKKVEQEKVKQEKASQLVTTPSGFYTATATIPIQTLKSDVWSYARRYYPNYPSSERGSDGRTVSGIEKPDDDS